MELFCVSMHEPFGLQSDAMANEEVCFTQDPSHPHVPAQVYALHMQAPRN